MILNIPFPQMLNTMITARAINARNQFVEALPMAEEARLRPIQMITGPVTTGGRYLMTFFTPTRRMINASTRYNSPAITIPPQAYAAFSLAPIPAYIPVSRCATVAKPLKNAKEEPKNAGTLNFAQTWNNRVPKPAQNKVTATVRPLVGPSPQASTK